MALIAASLGLGSFFYVVRTVLDDDNSVIHDDSYRKDQGERVIKLTEKPSNAIAAKAPIIVTGTVVAGTSIARKF